MFIFALLFILKNKMFNLKLAFNSIIKKKDTLKRILFGPSVFVPLNIKSKPRLPRHY